MFDALPALLAAYQLFAEQLHAELLKACGEVEDAWPRQVRAAVATALAFAVEKPGIARFLALATGAPAALRAAHDPWIDHLAAAMQERGEEAGAGPDPTGARLILDGVIALIGNRLAAGDLASLPGLEDDVTEVLLVSFRGWA